jgi:HSP20 family protein
MMMKSVLVPRRARRSAVPAVRSMPAIDDLFHEFFRGFGVTPAWPEAGRFGEFTPRIDIRETDEEVIVTAELPGLEEKDFEVELEEDVLTIKGEKRTEHEEKREGYRHIEIASGTFRRTIPLPSEVDADAVKATFKQGVVTVALPKLAEARRHARSVPIETS